MTNPKNSTTLPEEAVTEEEHYLTHEDMVKVDRCIAQLADTINKKLKRAVGKPVPFMLFTWGGSKTQYVVNVDRDVALSVVSSEIVQRWGEVQSEAKQ